MSGDASKRLSQELDRAVRTRGERLRAVASRAGREEAEDLAQDSLLRVVEAGARAPVDTPLHLLLRVVRNAAIDRLRAKGREAKVIRRGLTTLDAPDPTPGPERVLIASERLRQALAIIDAMPPKRREVFLLHRLEGLSYAQIARRAGISIKTVEKHMALAMAQLSREVDGQ